MIPKLLLFADLFKTFVRRKKKLIFFILCVFFLVIGLVWLGQRYLVKKVIVQGVVGTFQEKDLPLYVLNLLSKPLIRVDKSGEVQNVLIESWSSDEKSQEYYIKLKPNLVWSDGKSIKSSHIKFDIPGVEISYPDDLTIRYKLPDSFSPFPTLLGKPVFYDSGLTGTGPYRVSSVKKDSVFVSRITLISDDPDLPEVVIKFYPSEKIAKTALRLGEVQVLLGINEIEDLKTITNVNFKHFTNFEQIVTIFYDTKDAILSDENFRLALSFFAPSIKNEVEAKTSIPMHSWAHNSSVRDYLDNPDQGSNYLKKVKNGKDSEISLTVTSSLQKVGQLVVDTWNKSGVKAVLRVESGIPQNFQALLITQNIPVDPDQYSLWHSTQIGTNVSKFSSARIDKDLEDGRKIASREARLVKYQDFQKVLMDNAPATFLYFPKYNIVYLKKSEVLLNQVIKLQYPQFEE